MKIEKINIGKLFLITALIALVLGLFFGLFASLTYVIPDFLKQQIGFQSLRPLHVSLVMYWILLGATGCVYYGLSSTSIATIKKLALLQYTLWMLAIVGVCISYFTKNFGGREYWEFNPIWALPVAIAWVLFLINFFTIVAHIKNWPVYMWMWMTGILFFLFAFVENYLWLFPYFREHFIRDMTIQWKVNGSLVGAWNQLLYGTAFYLMDKISGKKDTCTNKLAFAMYFLGLFNLMFNWGHHIYTLPSDIYIKYISYAVSMTEWVFFVKIIYNWKTNISTIQKYYHYFPYRFLMAADIWVFINMGQAILMSIPAINIYTHGTHITVAHAMGTTIGINSMILLAACFMFIKFPKGEATMKILNSLFWILQISLALFWLALNGAGIKRGIWQLSLHQSNFSSMMDSLKPYFVVFVLAGFGILISLVWIAIFLIKKAVINEMKSKQKYT